MRPGRGTAAVRPPALALLVVLAGPVAAWAEDMPSFAVVLRDGTIDPARLEVPAERPFKLEISNTGTSPAEFESLSLHKEKVLSAGVTSSLVFRRLPAGEYDFFDDFHPEAKAVLVAR
jgi:hypothetical protein